MPETAGPAKVSQAEGGGVMPAPAESRPTREKPKRRKGFTLDPEGLRFYAKRLSVGLELLEDLGQGYFFDVSKARLAETLFREGLIAVLREDCEVLWNHAQLAAPPTRKAVT